MKKKIFVLTLITILMLTGISFGYTKIYDLTTETPISSGVTLKNIRRFITGGWLNINILEVDLTDPYVKVDMLTPENGMYNIDTVYNQAVAAEAIGAVNADFFTWVNNSKNGIPIGFGMKNGIITSGMYYKNATTNSMGTFVLSDTNIPYYEYIKAQEINLVNEDDEKVKVGDINTTSSDYVNPIIYTTAFRKNSIGKTDALPNILEIVVEANEVVEIRRGMEAVTIPKDGYVVTQATVSRDIRELKLTKVPTESGRSKYAIHQGTTSALNDKLVRVLRDAYISMDKAQNILVIKTVSGMAMAAAAALDSLELDAIVGCIAGDDTIMCAIRTDEQTEEVMKIISELIYGQ